MKSQTCEDIGSTYVVDLRREIDLSTRSWITCRHLHLFDGFTRGLSWVRVSRRTWTASQNLRFSAENSFSRNWKNCSLPAGSRRSSFNENAHRRTRRGAISYNKNKLSSINGRNISRTLYLLFTSFSRIKFISINYFNYIENNNEEVKDGSCYRYVGPSTSFFLQGCFEFVTLIILYELYFKHYYESHFNIICQNGINEWSKILSLIY